jgi:FlaG/FlaF family flagellin (archaellin)
MENKKIIILLIAIIVVLAAVLGVMLLNQPNKEATKVKITSDKSQYEGGELSIKLTGLNKTAISKEKVNIEITDKKGNIVVNKTAKTNSKGNAKLDLGLKKGKYSVDVAYGGNENYTGNNTTQKLTIKEKEVEKVTQTEEVTSAGNSLDNYRTRSDTKMMVMPSGDIVEMSADESTVVSVNGDPDAFF